jgi:hypothetical protein
MCNAAWMKSTRSFRHNALVCWFLYLFAVSLTTLLRPTLYNLKWSDDNLMMSWKRTWKEAVVAYFYDTISAFAWIDWGKPRKLQWGYKVSGPICEAWTSEIRSRSVNHSTTTSDDVTLASHGTEVHSEYTACSTSSTGKCLLNRTPACVANRPVWSRNSRRLWNRKVHDNAHKSQCYPHTYAWILQTYSPTMNCSRLTRALQPQPIVTALINWQTYWHTVKSTKYAAVITSTDLVPPPALTTR